MKVMTREAFRPQPRRTSRRIHWSGTMMRRHAPMSWDALALVRLIFHFIQLGLRGISEFACLSLFLSRLLLLGRPRPVADRGCCRRCALDSASLAPRRSRCGHSQLGASHFPDRSAHRRRNAIAAQAAAASSTRGLGAPSRSLVTRCLCPLDNLQTCTIIRILT